MASTHRAGAQHATPARDSDEAADEGSVGKTLTVYGRVAWIDIGAPDNTDPKRLITYDRLVLAIGGQEAICSFPIRETSPSPLSALQTGEPAGVLGRIERVEAGRMFLTECKLVRLPQAAQSKTPETKP